ncbi:MAG: TolB-like translocation protein [Candidatus Dormibacteria bacterium]
MRRLSVALVLLMMWAAFGFGVYHLLESRKSALATPASVAAPDTVAATVPLPGTIYVSQAGVLYRLRGGTFTKLPLPVRDGAWMQPAAGPGGDLLAVARSSEYADIYLVDPQTGTVVQQLTRNESGTVELNSWSFWPHLEADGTTIISGWDGPKYGTSYEVHFGVWSGTTAKVDARSWTSPTLYTGGDTQPVPVPGGGVLYAHYALVGDQILSRIALVARPGAQPSFLTDAASDCSAPAVNATATEIAMVCTSNTQTATLEVMPFDRGVAGTPRVLVGGCLCASPQFSPDGNDLVYLAPVDASGNFQLWWIRGGASAAPASPRAVTTHLNLDGTSAPAWLAG